MPIGWTLYSLSPKHGCNKSASSSRFAGALSWGQCLAIWSATSSIEIDTSMNDNFAWKTKQMKRKYFWKNVPIVSATDTASFPRHSHSRMPESAAPNISCHSRWSKSAQDISVVILQFAASMNSADWTIPFLSQWAHSTLCRSSSSFHATDPVLLQSNSSIGWQRFVSWLRIWADTRFQSGSAAQRNQMSELFVFVGALRIQKWKILVYHTNFRCDLLDRWVIHRIQ